MKISCLLENENHFSALTCRIRLPDFTSLSIIARQTWYSSSCQVCDYGESSQIHRDRRKEGRQESRKAGRKEGRREGRKETGSEKTPKERGENRSKLSDVLRIL